MSDQISEKMARNVYYSGTSGEWRELEDEFIANLKRKGLIKPSKLDEAKSYVQKMKDFPRSFPDGVAEMGIRVAENFEAAIAEILEERE